MVIDSKYSKELLENHHMSLMTEFREYQKSLKEGYFKMHPADTHSYTVYKKDLNSGKLSHKEHLDNSSELEDWMEKAYGKHVTILVRRDTDGNEVTYTDNGQKFEVIDKKKGSR